jgi:hypothetical protein
MAACAFAPFFQGRAPPDLFVSLTLVYYNFHITAADILLDRRAFGRTYAWLGAGTCFNFRVLQNSPLQLFSPYVRL